MELESQQRQRNCQALNIIYLIYFVLVCAPMMCYNGSMKTKLAIILLCAMTLSGCNVTLRGGHGHYVRPVYRAPVYTPVYSVPTYCPPVYGPSRYYGPLHRRPAPRYIRRW